MASFTTAKLVEDFMQQLGITQAQLNKNISNTILGGSLNYYGAKNLKTLAFKDRAGIATEVCKYTKDYVQSDAFQKDYAQMRESNKPREGNKILTPEEMRADMVSRLKESITKTEASLKTANAQMKPIFEDLLKQTKKQLKEAEDPLAVLELPLQVLVHLVFQLGRDQSLPVVVPVRRDSHGPSDPTN